MAGKTIQIVQGSDISITIDITQKDQDSGTSKPFPLGGFTGATAYFAAASGGSLYAFGSLVSADLGRLNFPLNEIQTGGLLAGSELNIEVLVDQGSTRTIAQILGKLEVDSRLFS